MSALLSADSPAYRANRRLGDRILVPMAEAELLLPAAIGDYTDFYASVHHATNVGSMFRPDNPLLPNYKWVPIGYHGRASSIVPSGTPVRRPARPEQGRPNADAPSFGPTPRARLRDGAGLLRRAGQRARASRCRSTRAEEHLFGFCLVNDWSARDIQAWEYQPLGPFLAKNFATTISPWVVTLEALEPFRVPGVRAAGRRSRAAAVPRLARGTRERGGVDVTVEVCLSPRADARAAAPAPMRLSRGSAADLYWTPAQLLAHHTSNGCNLRPGDLLRQRHDLRARRRSRAAVCWS